MDYTACISDCVGVIFDILFFLNDDKSQVWQFIYKFVFI